MGSCYFNGILMGVVVVIASCMPRYRRHPLFRFLFLGASTLFLPIVSEVAATLGGDQYFSGILSSRHQVIAAKCQPGVHVVLVLLWTGLVVLIGVNTSAVVAGDAREGRTIGPPTELLIKAIWTAYLIYVTTTKKGFLSSTRYLTELLRIGSLGRQVQLMFALLTMLTILKLLFKYIRFHRAQRSVALGRSPRFIVGYMAEQPDELPRNQGADQPPALIVQGEETGVVQKMSHGYTCIFEGTTELVTLDKIWGSDDNDFLESKHKDLCFSFALFKLLRCRFAKYTVLEAGFMKARSFFQAILLQGDDCERVFQVVADELSFIHDYYYSTSPSNVILSVLSLSCCAYMLVFILGAFHSLGRFEQIYCLVWCPGRTSRRGQSGDRKLYSKGYGDNEFGTYLDFGRTYYDVVPVCLVIVVLVFSEIRDIVSNIGSKWSKVSLVCKYAKNASLEPSTTFLRKRIAFVFRYCRFELAKSWQGKMNQCSILVLRPWKISLRLRCLLRLPNQKKTKQHIRLPVSPVPDYITGLPSNAFSVCGGKGASDTILAWHIATSIYEVRHPQSSDAKIAATHLSRYCAYLVMYLPGLLPDDEEWCEVLHQDVKKDVDHALAGRATSSEALTPEAECQQLMELLSANSNHEVVMNGMRIGKQLVKSRW
ncbi:hypothetical protein HU200_000402 [Digitaria exilis]|uniref:DUF4220 domain-containing protein n=1 Tax=Digitaria exilis TaxID=1010633 RepID=A0A835G0H8_9POAL|nr:hypothetical protein HU200_000402 [Digitaria exilis]